MERHEIDFVGCEKTNGGPMERHCSSVIGYDRTPSWTMKTFLSLGNCFCKHWVELNSSSNFGSS